VGPTDGGAAWDCNGDFDTVFGSYRRTPRSSRGRAGRSRVTLGGVMPRLLRTLTYAAVGAVAAMLLGRLLQLGTGLACTCFLGDPLVALEYGALGGVFFSFIYRPDLFGPPRAPSRERVAVTSPADPSCRT